MRGKDEMVVPKRRECWLRNVHEIAWFKPEEKTKMEMSQWSVFQGLLLFYFAMLANC